MLQAPPPLDQSIDVIVAGQSICCSKSMDDIMAILRTDVLAAVEGWIANNTSRDSTTPLPTVALELQSPYILFALRTDTCALLTRACPANSWHAVMPLIYGHCGHRRFQKDQ